MTQRGSRSARAQAGELAGWTCLVLGAVGAVVGVAALHLGVLLFAALHSVPSSSPPVGDAYARAGSVGLVLLFVGVLVTFAARLSLAFGTRLLESSARSPPFEASPWRRRSGRAGGAVAALGPPLVGIVGTAVLGHEAFWALFLLAAGAYVGGLVLVGIAVRAVLTSGRG